MRAAKRTLGPNRSSAPCKERREVKQGARGETAVLTGPKGTECDLSGQCSVCGHCGELFGLPGRSGKYCLECSADVATVILLTAEIDAATLVGRNTNELVAEFAHISHRMLDRAQSAELGNT